MLVLIVRLPPSPHYFKRSRGYRKRGNADRTATVDFETFSKILNRPGGFRDPGEPEEYCRGFQVFDKDMTGFIGVGQLRYILTNLGEKMSDDEVDELLKAVDTSSGEINYTGTSSLPFLSQLQGWNGMGGRDEMGWNTG
jgi:hypothetical protein